MTKSPKKHKHKSPRLGTGTLHILSFVQFASCDIQPMFLDIFFFFGTRSSPARHFKLDTVIRSSCLDQNKWLTRLFLVNFMSHITVENTSHIKNMFNQKWNIKIRYVILQIFIIYSSSCFDIVSQSPTHELSYRWRFNFKTKLETLEEKYFWNTL